MKDYKNILLATDLSSKSEKVAQRAHMIAKEHNATLSAIYVMEHSPVAYGGEYSIPIDASLEESLQKKASASLAKLGTKFEIDPSNQYIENGSVKLSVTDLASEKKIDLLVIGAHAHHGIEVILGSRASAILHHAQCDVLVVHVD